MRVSGVLAGFALSIMSVSANADDWKRGESPHFVVYSTQGERDLAGDLDDLERVDQAIRVIRGQEDPPLGDGNRVTVFMLRKVEHIQELMGTDEDFSGFYTYRRQGPIAVTPRTDRDRYNQKQETFFHEYAHHLMFQDLDRPSPKWLVEGFAEFFSTAVVKRDGSVEIGRPGASTAYTLTTTKTVPLEQLFDQRLEYSGRSLSSFYATSWLLTHFLVFDPERKKQFDEYMDLLATGTPSREAAPLTFGDLDDLESDLRRYQRGKITYLKIPSDRLSPPPVEVVRLNEGDSAAIEAYLSLWLERDEPELLAELRAAAPEYRGSGLFMTTLAMAELANGNAAKANEAADAAMANMPDKVEPIIMKIRALLVLAETADEPDPLYDEARKLSVQANRIDPEDPEPLLYFYETSLHIEGRPSDNAIEGLYYAALVAPQDQGTRLNTAYALMNKDRKHEARQLLEGMANDPHNPGIRESARKLLAELEGKMYVPPVTVDLSENE